jgi:hypothetical protein
MQLFNINENLSVICKTADTRNGFKHTATLMRNGQEADSAKVFYLNRTWERFTFETVLEKLASKLRDDEKARLLEAIKMHGDKLEEESNRGYAAVATVAKMGEWLTETQADANDWKLRMIKAGMESRGLSIPDNWGQLTEDEKQKRLDSVIAELEKENA